MKITTIVFSLVISTCLVLVGCGEEPRSPYLQAPWEQVSPSATPAPSGSQEPSSHSTQLPGQTSSTPQEGDVEEHNFRLLISDEENAIGDFARLLVTFKGFELERDTGGWYPGDGLIQPQLPTVDLVELQGAAAEAIWEGDVEEATYVKLRLIPDDATGVRGELAPPGGVPEDLDPDEDFDGDGVVNGEDNCRYQENVAQGDSDGDGIGDACSVFVELPSGRFEWEPRDDQGEKAGFTIGGTDAVSFVYDFTVVRRGPPGDHDYLVQPEIGETGPNQFYHEVSSQDRKEDESAGLTLQFQEDVQPGSSVTVAVTNDSGKPVEGASIRLEAAGMLSATDADGQATISVLAGTSDLHLEVENGDSEGRLEIRFGDAGVVDEEADYGELSVKIEGSVEAGAPAIVRVTDGEGHPVVGALVQVGLKQNVGGTDELGQLLVEIPPYAEEVSLEARLDNLRGELEWESDDGEDQENAEETGDEEASDDLAFYVEIEGQLQAGAQVTVVVTDPAGSPVSGAEVEVNGEIVGNTDVDGKLAITVPGDADELEIEAKTDEAEGKLVTAFE